MSKYPSFAIVVSFFGLWISTLFSSENEVFIGFAFILTFGILHGANDLLILKNLLTEKTAISFSKMLLYYIIVVFFGGFLFFIVPSFVLVFFILISGFHFGEQQLNYLDSKIETKTLSLIRTSYGLVVLFLLFALHSKEVQTIISEITTHTISNLYIMYGLYLVLILFAICFLYLYFKTDTPKNKLLLEIFYLIVFAIIFKVSSLIWGFAIYFIIWHSIPSLLDQIKFLYGDFTKNNCFRYVKSALLYWIMSITGLALFYFIFKEVKLFNSMFFSFLAAITFPHVLVILKMFGKKV
jgi:beta-carotene 15,15'-dioxygenase